MPIITKFEEQYPAIGTTELWNLLKAKIVTENLTANFLIAVSEICKIGVVASKDIIRFFPTFTLHDETHIVNVCNWMVRLLGKRKENLLASEAALLVMAACCHDVGMSVKVEQEEALSANPRTLEWREYFKQHPKDEEEFNRTKVISKRMLRNYVRKNHHRRIADQIENWDAALQAQQITKRVLINLCQSHGETLENLTVPRGVPYDLRLCAVLLRLSDILDFDSSRAPDYLFKHLGLEQPQDLEMSISQTEWAKNRAGVFGNIIEGIIPFTAKFTSLQLEFEVQTYLDWVQQELDSSSKYLSLYDGRWKDLRLPYNISRDNVDRNGYKFGKFCLTMDQDHILELLTGKNLYSDPGVFVRELLQNSIDAVLVRRRLDPYFGDESGKIAIYSWIDSEGYSWFRIEDDGIGMDESIITNYFLKVGCSYYTSDEFKADIRHYGRGKDYHSISRFGIGILSCFMGDSENNQLEVSTKRYSQDPMKQNYSIRLNVTGLHGYYYLANEQEQSAYDMAFKPIHHPQNTIEGYRSDVGTTICVRISLSQLGKYFSIKEIVDKYVQFPEVQVDYYGIEGNKSYLPHKKLMESVHRLNPDGPSKKSKEYIHPISDQDFAWLRKVMPNTIWIERPSVILRYIPLDWLSESENIAGVAIFASFRVTATNQAFTYQGEKIQPQLKFSFKSDPANRLLSVTFTNEFSREQINTMGLLREEINSMHIEGNSQHQYRDILSHFDLLYRDQYLTISFDDLLSQLDVDESNVFGHITKALQNNKSVGQDGACRSTITAYNGVLADTSNLLGTSDNFIGMTLLLRGAYCPEVNLARDAISSLPLEVACNLSVMQETQLNLRYIDGEIPEPFTLSHYALLPEQQLQQVIEKHPHWEMQLHYGTHSLTELKQSISLSATSYTEEKIEVPHFHKESLVDHMRLTILKRYFTVCIGALSLSPPYITNAPTHANTTVFPVTMFLSFPNLFLRLGTVGPNGFINCYDLNHRFSHWLIQNQDELQTLVPNMYNSIIESMVLGKNKSNILRTINTVLYKIKHFRNNLFGITDELFLRDFELEDRQM